MVEPHLLMLLLLGRSRPVDEVTIMFTESVVVVVVVGMGDGDAPKKAVIMMAIIDGGMMSKRMEMMTRRTMIIN